MTQKIKISEVRGNEKVTIILCRHGVDVVNVVYEIVCKPDEHVEIPPGLWDMSVDGEEIGAVRIRIGTIVRASAILRDWRGAIEVGPDTFIRASDVRYLAGVR